MRPASLPRGLRSARVDVTALLQATRCYSDVAVRESSENGPTVPPRRATAPIASSFGDISISNIPRGPVRRIIPVPAPTGEWKADPRLSPTRKAAGSTTFAGRLVERQREIDPSTFAGPRRESALKLQRRSAIDIEVTTPREQNEARDGQSGSRPRQAILPRQSEASRDKRTSSRQGGMSQAKSSEKPAPKLHLQRRSDRLAPTPTVTTEPPVSEQSDSSDPEVIKSASEVEGEDLLDSGVSEPKFEPTFVELDNNALDVLFSEPVNQESATIPSTPSSESRTPIKSHRTQLMLEETAGDYSRRLPVHLQSRLIDREQLGPVRYAEWALSKQRQADYGAKHAVLSVVKRYSGSAKEARL
ncbi:hypothetical protein NEOLEDRAFT_1144327 [Neolentinus lepideus HHB14362 ss-1]|uniref:Uncharacterized protein n=1 Tax=Neolentinus lepideus HHB14362 ss-1 TaxID=1314782 RepID=A0A165W781_9AGAM|nr:hypothetical protein NEOLEDRAFT_1144327 [Neolentinus lepideus HHB14362 ss-1]